MICFQNAEQGVQHHETRNAVVYWGSWLGKAAQVVCVLDRKQFVTDRFPLPGSDGIWLDSDKDAKADF